MSIDRANRRPGPGDESNSPPLDWLISPGRVFPIPVTCWKPDARRVGKWRSLASWASVCAPSRANRCCGSRSRAG